MDSGYFASDDVNKPAFDWLRGISRGMVSSRPCATESEFIMVKIPRAISQYAVKAFNEDRLRFLCMQRHSYWGGKYKGKKNVVIYDNKIARDKFDFSPSTIFVVDRARDV